MEAYIKRMIDEHKELVKRINKLSKFISKVDVNNKSECDEYVRLQLQFTYMKEYGETLLARLNARGIFYSMGIYTEVIEDTNDYNKETKNDDSRRNETTGSEE